MNILLLKYNAIDYANSDATVIIARVGWMKSFLACQLSTQYEQ